MEYIV